MSVIITFIVLLEFLISCITDTKISFWDNNPCKGANCMNEVPTEQWFMNASAINIQWVRLAYDKWDTDERDFLLGDVTDYRGLVTKDLKKLKEVLSWVQKYNLKVVITPLSLPGCRWSQNNNNKPDLRLWEDYAFQQKAIQFWIDLASELKDFSCIVAYDILNEPCPELLTNIEEQTVPGEADRFLDWYSQYKDTPRDLFLFYQRIIKAIRAVDTETPIMVESGFYAQPSAYLEWPDKLEDLKVLYSFHIYEPYDYTSVNNFRNGGKYVYPGKILFGSDEIWWDKSVMELYMKPFTEWLDRQSIPINRIVAAEFGCMRKNKGVEAYLEDILTLLEERGYHWAFYSYQEDGWDGYDYELGTQDLGWEYWKAIEGGEKPLLPRKNNSLFDIILKRLMTVN
jgi:hypothetical protein